MVNNIKFYGTSWCGDCVRSKFILDIHSIEYDYIDIDQDKKAKEYIVKLNDGLQSVPTIVFPDGSHLTEPSALQLTHKLGLNE